MIDKDSVLMINKNVEIVCYNQKSYVLCIDSEHEVKLNINSVSKELLEIFNGELSIKDVSIILNEKLDLNLNVEEIVELIKSKFLGYGIFTEDDNSSISEKAAFLRLRFTLLNSHLVRLLSLPFTFLFGKTVFLTTLIINTLIISLTIGYAVNFELINQSITPTTVLYSTIIFFVTVLLHEIGHAAACIRYGAKNGSIGLGFYLFRPVFYADVSDAWRLKRNERLIVDSGGMFMQSVIASLLCLVFLYTKSYDYLIYTLTVLSGLVVNLNPFLRYDGYWILSDALNIANLRQKSKLALREFYRYITKQSKSLSTKASDIFLMIYGVLSMCMIVLFLGYILFNKENNVFLFPTNVYGFIKNILINGPDVSFSYVKQTIFSFILPVTFYVLLWKTLKTQFLKWTN
jgi:putative peptide zinc metalloprotease protein